MNQNKQKLCVLVSKEVRDKLTDVLSEGEKTFGVEFSDDPSKCSSELFLELDENKIKQALKEDRVPILPKNNKFEDFNPVEEKGVAFTYDPQNAISIYDALIRARENYQFPYDWRNILKQGKRLAEV